ncbi:MAG TPA: hypothetical protein VK327_09355, partial [Candidatus Paceibacterota bacterium]|nr:hypothetical protein [Candidatus Paceibacterota bacterium]
MFSTGLYVLAMGRVGLMAQSADLEDEFHWMRMRITETSLGVESEGDFQKQTLAGSNQDTTRKVVYVVPTFGLNLQSSFYHPNFLELRLNTLDGIGWQEASVGGANGGTRTSSPFLQRYDGNIAIFKQQPYAADVFASKDHTIRDYDFFTRATVDNQTYGGRVGYSQGVVPFGVALTRMEEEVSGTSRGSRLDQTTLNFTASNSRQSDSRTDLSYTLNDYTRFENGLYGQDGTEHSANLFDIETFGRTNQVQLNSSMFYNQLDSTINPVGRPRENPGAVRSFSDNEQLTLKHTERLESSYNYGFNKNDSGPATSDGHSADAGLHHQLYGSLASGLDVHGQTFTSGGNGSSLTTTRYGVGVNENYTKKMSQWGRLNLGYNVLLDHEQRESVGQVLFIVGESHTLSDGVLTFLNQPNVNTFSIRV